MLDICPIRVKSRQRDAAIGERADLLLHARTAEGSSLLRLVAVVSEEPADSVQIEARDQDTPAAAPLAALVCSLVLMRRRGVDPEP